MLQWSQRSKCVTTHCALHQHVEAVPTKLQSSLHSLSAFEQAKKQGKLRQMRRGDMTRGDVGCKADAHADRSQSSRYVHVMA
jgi:hypothetical protein